MIPRYSRPEMTAIWEPATKFRIWYEIEAHACDAMADLGVIPRENAEAVWKAKDVEFDVARIDEIEAVTKHDVIAFLTHLAEIIGNDEARFVHQGMTSSDVLDTTLNVQLTRAADLLLAGLDRVLAALKTRAYEHKDTIRIGRSHGIHAEPTTMGLTFARFYAEMDRNRARLAAARAEIATGAISGAVGTFANIDPAVEDHVCAKMGLAPEPISTQVIPRDRHAMFFAPLGVLIAWRRSPKAIAIAFVVGFALSLGVEVGQSMVPGRSSSLIDLASNSAGALLGAVVARLPGWVQAVLR